MRRENTMFKKILTKITASSRIIIIRHAETVWNAPRKRIQGQSIDPSITLSDKGIKETTIKFSGMKKPDILICSPLFRCKQTAEIITGETFNKISCEKYTHDGLKEVHAGLLEGYYVDELETHKEYKEVWDAWKKNPINFLGFPQGEKLLPFQKRVLTAFSEICSLYGDLGKEVYVISHAGPLSILTCFLDNKTLDHLWDKSIPNIETIELTKEQIIKLQNYSLGMSISQLPKQAEEKEMDSKSCLNF